MQHVRPTWDEYFLQFAVLTSKRSNCLRRSVGCVLVNSNNRILSTGMNGTPRGIENCFNGGCARCNDKTIKSGDQLENCLCIHAEENALLFCDFTKIEGSTLYCTHFPCTTCVKKIIQVNIKRIVYLHEYDYTIKDNFYLINSVGIICQSAKQLKITIN